MKLPDNANVSLAPGEEKRIQDAVEAIGKDAHAPRTLTVTMNLHVHNEYPRHLYKGEGTARVSIVNSGDEEAAAREAGFGDFQPETAKEEV